MGVVYRAYDAFLDRTVAIKMMSADLDAEPHYRDRFFREARVAVQLDHRNIVKIHDLAEEEGRAYIVMEFLDGEELSEMIKRGGTVPLERRLEVMRHIADALAYAHRHEVIHRDIKPGNIQITSDGEVKILDFGLARITDSTMTATGAVLGTPSYMSPEQVGGTQADLRSDIFSMGAVFHELLTGHRPFTGESIAEIFNKIASEDTTPIHEVNTLLPEELSTIITKSMAKDPDDRYQSMEELRAALERFDDTLERARLEVRQEAEAGFRSLRELHSQHEKLLARPGFVEDPAATQKIDFLDVERLPGTASVALEAALPDGYLELHAVVQLAAGEYCRTEALIEKLGWVAERSTRPVEEESEEEIRRLANRLDEILADYPGHPGTEEYRDRLLGELTRRQQEARLAELMESARALHGKGDAEAALKALNEALKVDSDHEAALSLREQVDRQIEEQRAREERMRQASQALAAAREALAANSVVTARAEVEKALELDPEAEGAAALLAEVKELEEEIRARRGRQQDIEGMLQDARELADAGREQEAITRLDELIEVEPEFEQALALRGEIERWIAIREEERGRREDELRQRQEEELKRREEESRRSEARIKEKLKRAAHAMDAGEFEEVLELAAQVLDDDADQPEALALREHARAGLAELRQQTADAVRLTQELEAARDSGEPGVPPASLLSSLRESPLRAGLSIGAVVTVILLAWAMWPATAPEPSGSQSATPASTTGMLFVDASPWAYIAGIFDADGNAVTLVDADGSVVPPNEDVSTPFSLAVQPGTYTVQLRAPGSDETHEVTVDVTLGGIAPAFHSFETVGAEDYFAGVEW